MAITVSTHWTIREAESIAEQALSLRAEVLGLLAAHCDLQAAKTEGEDRQRFIESAKVFRNRQAEEMERSHAA